MSNKITYQHFSANDIFRYHNGQLTTVQMQAMELQALEDPILADAMDGFINVDEKMANKNLKFLQQQITQKQTKVVTMHTAKKITWFRIAAAASVAGIAIFIGASLFNNKKTTQVAQNDKTNIDTVQTKTQNDTNFVNKNFIQQTNSTIATAKVPTAAANNYTFVKPDALTAYYETGKVAPVIVEDGTITDDVGTSKIQNFDSIKQPEFKREIAAKPAEKMEESDANDFNKLKKESTPAAPSIQTNNTINAGTYSTNATINTLPVYNGTVNNTVVYNADKKRVYDFAVAPKAKSNIKNPNYNNFYFNYKVIDAQGNHIPFTNVSIPADQLSTYSRVDGRFGLFSTDSVLIVNIKADGYVAKTLQLSATQNYQPIVLQELINTNDNDVVVVGETKQKAIQKSSKIQTVIDAAEPLDGIDNYATYVLNNLDNSNKPQGEVVLTFTIDKLGDPTNIKIDKSLSSSADQEAIRLLSQGPKWKAKTKKAKKAKIIIRF